MKKASPFICGTVILTLSNFFSRLIGFYNRIFLAGVIGAHQIGIYQLIFISLGLLSVFRDFRSHFLRSLLRKKLREILMLLVMYFALRSFLHCAFVSFSPSLYFGMQNWSVQFFFMNQAVYHAWDLLFLFFHLSGSKTVFMGTALELRIRVFLLFLCVWNRFQGYPLSFYFLYSW